MQVALDRRPRALVQRGDDLLVVDRLRLLRRPPARPGRRRTPRPRSGRSSAGCRRTPSRTPSRRRRCRASSPAGTSRPPLKIPLTFFAPTLLGNSAGSFGPFARNRNFGLNFACTSRLDLRVRVAVLRAADDRVRCFDGDLLDDRRHVGRLGRIDRLVDGLDAALLEDARASRRRSATRTGRRATDTPPSSAAATSAARGGSFAKTSPHLTTGAGCVKKTLCSFSSNTAGPPPAGSMNA